MLIANTTSSLLELDRRQLLLCPLHVNKFSTACSISCVLGYERVYSDSKAQREIRIARKIVDALRFSLRRCIIA